MSMNVHDVNMKLTSAKLTQAKTDVQIRQWSRQPIAAHHDGRKRTRAFPLLQFSEIEGEVNTGN